MWLACYTEDEIAESVKVEQQTINRWILQKKQDIVKSVIFPESLQIYNIWSGYLISVYGGATDYAFLLIGKISWQKLYAGNRFSTLAVIALAVIALAVIALVVLRGSSLNTAISLDPIAKIAIKKKGREIGRLDCRCSKILQVLP